MLHEIIKIVGEYYAHKIVFGLGTLSRVSRNGGPGAYPRFVVKPRFTRV